MKFNTVIFDLDGTLTDTVEDLKNSVNYALRKFSFPERTSDEIRRFAGNGVARLVALSVPEGTDDETTEAVLEAFRPFYKEHSLDNTAPYDGVIPLVAKLRDAGIKMAVVSNKMHPATVDIVSHFFGDYIKVAIGQSEAVARKPAPDSVFKAAEILGSDLKNAVYIGDSEVDCATAKNSGIPVIGVCWGFRGRKVLEENDADYIVDSPDEIPGIIGIE